MHHSLQIMFVLPLMTGHLFWKAIILGGLYRGVQLYCAVQKSFLAKETVYDIIQAKYVGNSILSFRKAGPQQTARCPASSHWRLFQYHKDPLPGYEIHFIKIRWKWDSLIFIMRFLYWYDGDIETAKWVPLQCDIRFLRYRAHSF